MTTMTAKKTETTMKSTKKVHPKNSWQKKFSASQEVKASAKSAKKSAKKAPTRKPFTPTAAQAEATAARREKMRGLARAVSAMTPEARMSIFSAHPVMTIEGKALSMYNTCFLVSQLETVTVVGGFAQWRAAGRVVKKGEHGLAIWIPMKGAAQKEDPNRQEGEISSKDLEIRFVLATVFDVAQTSEITA